MNILTQTKFTKVRNIQNTYNNPILNHGFEQNMEKATTTRKQNPLVAIKKEKNEFLTMKKPEKVNEREGIKLPNSFLGSDDEEYDDFSEMMGY